MKFAHLHVHSDASLKDGLSPVATLVAQAKANGFQALALTDHGTLANAIAFTIECERVGIKPILGVEGYMQFENVKGETEVGHITLLANGNIGWQNLVELQNIAHASDRKYPAFTLPELIAHSEDVVVLSGCVGSPMNSLPWEQAVLMAKELKRNFGPRFFIEVMFISDMPTWERPVQLAEYLKLPVVVTNDVHFPSRSDRDVHTILMKIKAGFTYQSEHLWLKQPAEILHHARRLMGENFDEKKVTNWIMNAGRIAQHIKPVVLKSTPSLPHIANADAKLRKLVGSKLTGRGLTYTQRAKYELATIAQMDYSAYFLILHDLVTWAKNNRIRVGAGRGSGAGSLVLYLLGITAIDPIQYGLSFERFLNKERKSMPDVDLDFDSERRPDLLAYAKKKYNAYPIATYSRYMHKSLVHELGKFFRIPKDQELAAAENGPDSVEFKGIMETKPDFARAYDTIIGQIRHKGKHAGGVIITDSVVPVERTGDTLSAAWTEGSESELSYAGIVKFDLLGLSALAILRRLEENFGLPEYTYTDPEVYKIFQSGRLSGIFQFAGSPGIRDLTMKLNPQSIEDLTAINALYRPGALDAGTCQLYPEFKKKPRVVPNLFTKVLAPTYGVVVYQEQLMEMVRLAVGGTLAEADIARSTITKGGKKLSDPVIAKKMDDLHKNVVSGLVIKGFEEDVAEKWWEELEAHGRYSFNKSHSTSYSVIAWEMAWWKANNPAAFYAECLNIDQANAQDYIMSAVYEGVTIHQPLVNFAKAEWSSTATDSLVMPLSALKFITPDTAQVIVDNAPYVSIVDMVERLPRKIFRSQVKEALYYTNSLQGLRGGYDDLKIKKAEVHRSRTDNMLAYMGFVIPTSDQVKKMRDFMARGWLVGIVSDKSKRSSRYGPYTVYYLSPTGSFWTREAIEYPTGLVVAVRKNGKGKALELERL